MQAFPFDSELTYDEHDNPIYDRAVSSQPLRKLIKELFTTGVMPNPSTNFQVSAGNDGMTVQVAGGFAVIDGGLCHETETRTLEVTAADNTYDRIDTVVLRWNENVDIRTADLYVVAGTPAVNPVRPTLQRNNSIYEIGLADVFITKRVATITTDKITDTRYEAERCGVVSSISEFDTTTLYQQIQADLAGFKEDEQANFIAWFETIQNILDSDTAGHLQNEIDYIRPKVHTNLLNPNLYVNVPNTYHGMTVTSNEDGTFTLDGTADTDAGSDGFIAINLTSWGANTIMCENQTQVRLCGCPSGYGGNLKLQIVDTNEGDQKNWQVDTGNGVTVELDDGKLTLYALRIEVKPNTTLDNAVIKPMITTNLTATYNDYVEYSGAGELNANVGVHERKIAQLNSDLTANAKKFKFAYDSVKNKYGYTIDGTFYPFRKGAIYVGVYSAVTNIDISAYGATSANQFLAVASSTDSYNVPATSASDANNYYGMGWINVTANYTAPSVSLSGDTVTIRPAMLGGSGSSNHAGAGRSDKFIATKLYFVGDIE